MYLPFEIKKSQDKKLPNSRIKKLFSGHCNNAQFETNKSFRMNLITQIRELKKILRT